ncbi:unnamed protein product [Heligmosomoides polygyrus]|uniref:Serine/threonine kinase n=1 Tax=Heligmosomoides polygyrus TaxID=6339 RepID=A0A3P8DGU7_HELPZ|nr:unnamed protein product [Heligmosomoides polygyrus]
MGSESRTSIETVVEGGVKTAMKVRKKTTCTSTSDICGRLEVLVKAESRIKRLASRLDCSEKQSAKEDNLVQELKEELERQKQRVAELEAQQRGNEGPRVGRNDVEIPDWLAQVSEQKGVPGEDLRLFINREKEGRRKFTNYDNLKSDIADLFESQPPEFWVKGIGDLPNRWATVVDNCGDYIVD